MTDEQINVAIAHACGWKHPNNPDVIKFKVGWTTPEKWWMCPKGVLRLRQDIPNFATDLNAMHEAEWALLCKKGHGVWECYRNKLRSKYGEDDIRATARERAEAFLRTLGKWEEIKQLV